jgi:hypothetical protein
VISAPPLAGVELSCLNFGGGRALERHLVGVQPHFASARALRYEGTRDLVAEPNRLDHARGEMPWH